MINEIRINIILNLFSTLYFIFLCAGVVATLVVLINISGEYGSALYTTPLYAILYPLIVYIGLKKRKGWLIPLILLTSAYQAYSGFLSLHLEVLGITTLTEKLFGYLLLLFSLYKLAFFTRPEVQRAFGEKGTVLF